LLGWFSWSQAEPLLAWSCRWYKGRSWKLPSDEEVRLDLSAAQQLPGPVAFPPKCLLSALGDVSTAWCAVHQRSLPSVARSLLTIRTVLQRVTKKAVVPLGDRVSLPQFFQQEVSLNTAGTV